MPRKQTSSKVSSLAGKWLQACKTRRGKKVCVPRSELRAICASALSQDEVKEQKR